MSGSGRRNRSRWRRRRKGRSIDQGGEVPNVITTNREPFPPSGHETIIVVRKIYFFSYPPSIYYFRMAFPSSLLPRITRSIHSPPRSTIQFSLASQTPLSKSFHHHQITTKFSKIDPNRAMPTTRNHSTQQEMAASKENGEKQEKVEGWKTKPPYSIHKSNDDFKVVYEANCHCERVKYQLSRDAPLDSKLCHCTTCQSQHGTSPPNPFQPPANPQEISTVKTGIANSRMQNSRAVPMGCHLPQGRHQLHPRPP
jgi:hypothetical protein